MPDFGPILNAEVLNNNALISYPLTDDSSEYDVTGTFKLPRDLIVELQFPVDVNLLTELTGYHVLQVGIFAGGITISIGYTPTAGGTTLVGQVSVVAASHTLNASYFIAGVGDFEGSLGRITLGDLTETLKTGGVFTFDKTGARLLPIAIPPDLRQIHGIRVRNGAEVSDIFDDVELASGQNTRWVVEEDSLGNRKLRIDALSRTDLNSECGCENEDALPPPIRTINDVPPRPDGSFDLLGDSCITITPGSTIGEAGVVQIKDVCSEPCCGAPELKVVEDDINQLNLDVRSLSNMVNQIEVGLETMNDLRVGIEATGIVGDNPSP